MSLLGPFLNLAYRRIPPLTATGGQFAVDIQAQATVENYSKTPDGWFVPLAVLMDKIEAVADYLCFETLYYDGFEVGGGFEIIADDGQ